MKPSEVESTGDLDDFWMNNIEYIEQLEALVDEVYSIWNEKQSSDFFKNVLEIVEQYKEILY